jgi:uncharacterized protein YdeI (YjbR/CyaY-like superfamily)
MQTVEKVETYYKKEHTFKEGVRILRELLKETKLKETYKWSLPTYTLHDKNVLAICRFNHHFGIWFFNGVLLNDAEQVLENVQEGKTKAMRHWKFTSEKEINPKLILSYINEAISLQEKGIKFIKQSPNSSNFKIPQKLMEALDKDILLKQAFGTLPTYKQKDYANYISSAKQDKTKHVRLAKILPLIKMGKGLNDKYT